jgi:septum formation protein
MAEPSAAPLVLASGSPFRRKMLEAAGLSFQVVPPDVDEGVLKRGLAGRRPQPGPEVIAGELAAAKALAVAGRFPGALVIGADQVLALGDELLDKPGDLAAAREQLLRLRGRTHRLHTAVALAQASRIVWSHAEHATLAMRSFSIEFLESYLAKAGSGLCRIVGGYEIEGLGIQLLERVEGDHFTVIGLPLLPLLAELRFRRVIAS